MQLEIINKSSGNSKNQPLLFIHGMFHGAWCWEPYFMPYFSDLGYDTYALSLRNHAGSGSEKPMWRVRVKEYVDDVRQAVASIDGDPILIGHSMGGFIIQKYLEKYQAPAVILLASVPPKGIIMTSVRVVKKHPLSFIKTNLTLNFRYIISNFEEAKHLLFSPNLPDAEAKTYHEKLENEAYLAYFDMLGFDLPKVKQIDAPKMLVIGAEKDTLISVAETKKTADAYEAQHVVIPNIAHDVMLDVNWKDTAQVIKDWLLEN